EKDSNFHRLNCRAAGSRLRNLVSILLSKKQQNLPARPEDSAGLPSSTGMLHCFTPVTDHTPSVIKPNLDPRLAGPIGVVLIGVLLVAVLWWTSYYTVGAESEGVVLRFGKFLKTVEPGLHFKLPFGIDTVTVLPTRRQLKLEFGFTTPGYLTNPIQAS